MNGDIIVTDFSSGRQVGKISNEFKTEIPQSCSYINSGLNILVGYVDGTICCYDSTNYNLQSIVDNVHKCNKGLGTNCLISLNIDKQAKPESKSGKDKPISMSRALPIIISGGADGKVRIFEHNPYYINNKQPAPEILKVSDKLDADLLKGMTHEELSSLFREQVTEQISKHLNDSDKADKVIEKILTSKQSIEVDGDKKELDEWQYDLVKMLTDKEYLNRSF